MTPFFFKGSVSASKSLMNRALLAQSYSSEFEVRGDSQCDDVQKMREGLRSLLDGNEIDCGEGGSVLRFLALRASRVKGKHRLKGSVRLFARPLGALLEILDQFGVEYEVGPTHLEIESQGWRQSPTPIVIDRSLSSQFASGVLFNSWELPFPLVLHWSGQTVSDGYWNMSLTLASRLGMKWELSSDSHSLLIPSSQKIHASNYSVELDLSSAFALAALAAVSGSLSLSGFPEESLQPDAIFVDILKKMGVPITLNQGVLQVHQATSLKPIEWNLSQSPDLFPVLSVLCALADGTSLLMGAPQLEYKESNRIQEIAKLLTLLNRRFDLRPDGLTIYGSQEKWPEARSSFSCANDHRLAMAAQIAIQSGASMDLIGREVVFKSFPEYWAIVQGGRAQGPTP